MTSKAAVSVTEKYQQLQNQRNQKMEEAARAVPAANQDKEHYEDVDHIINTVIEEIWDEFDDDGNGTLDVNETHLFVKTTLQEMGEKPDYSDEDFNECFKFFQTGGPGVITKLEMRIFVKKIAGLDTKDDEAADKLEKAAAMGNEEVQSNK